MKTVWKSERFVCRCAAALLFLLFARVGWAAPAENSIAFTYEQGCIFLRLRVNETEDLCFLLDTGARASAVDAQTAERLKLPFVGAGQVEGTAGVMRTRQVRIERLAVGNARAQNLRVPAYDLSGALAPPGTRLDGILGYDFLRAFAVRLDFTARTITFATHETKSDDRSAICLPFTLENGVPRFAATLNDNVATAFRLDTGASLFASRDVYLNVTTDVWEQLQATDSLQPQQYFTGRGVGGELRLPVARIRSLSMAALNVAAPFVIVQPRQGYFARPAAVGFVSNNLLEKFSPVTICYVSNALCLSRQSSEGKSSTSDETR